MRAGGVKCLKSIRVHSFFRFNGFPSRQCWGQFLCGVFQAEVDISFAGLNGVQIRSVEYLSDPRRKEWVDTMILAIRQRTFFESQDGQVLTPKELYEAPQMKGRGADPSRYKVISSRDYFIAEQNRTMNMVSRLKNEIASLEMNKRTGSVSEAELKSSSVQSNEIRSSLNPLFKIASEQGLLFVSKNRGDVYSARTF